MPFAREYVEHVLKENFEDAKRMFLGPLVAIHEAHLVMLAKQRIITGEDARVLARTLRSLSLEKVRAARYDGSCEDLFFYVERLIAEQAGDEIAGRLHTARSRNDIDMTMYRMRQREFVLGFLSATLDLRRVLVGIARRHPDDVFAALTHTQPAQPTTLGHYVLAVAEQLTRDATRLLASSATINRCPLGACAITGTGFPIDRDLTSALLGFDGPTGNTYDSIATVDYLLESTSAVATALGGLGRVLQDLLLWCSADVGYLRLAEGFVQCSSIMPQKRNPSALEHARALASKALGQFGAIVMTVHNTPFGDIVDTEDDLQPLVFSMFTDAIRSVTLVSAALEHAVFDTDRLGASAERGWITVTELADTLVRDHKIPFKTAHAITARFVEDATARTMADPASGPSSAFYEAMPSLLAGASEGVLGRRLEYSAKRLREILSARHFVQIRSTPGGPSPEEIARGIQRADDQLTEDSAALQQRVDALRAAEIRRSKEVAALAEQA